MHPISPLLSIPIISIPIIGLRKTITWVEDYTSYRIINPAATGTVEVDKLWNMAGESIPTTGTMPCE
jgi:hypothetical protein